MRGDLFMTEKTVNTLMSVLLGTALWCCKRSSETIVGPPIPSNLISNSSFEINGTPSLLGWVARDTFTVRLVAGAPPGGGNWSLRFEATWPPASFAETVVHAPLGKHSYKFSLWGKHGGEVIGGAVFLVKHADSLS